VYFFSLTKKPERKDFPCEEKKTGGVVGGGSGVGGGGGDGDGEANGGVEVVEN
jgi:hypothetical protein